MAWILILQFYARILVHLARFFFVFYFLFLFYLARIFPTTKSAFNLIIEQSRVYSRVQYTERQRGQRGKGNHETETPGTVHSSRSYGVKCCKDPDCKWHVLQSRWRTRPPPSMFAAIHSGDGTRPRHTVCVPVRSPVYLCILCQVDRS